ncbi:MAG: class I SAM-dependent methyltransferase [Cytophagales bacterium]|nr:class I SAM-dependent methyltransferase [Cytophagales bacterium]
MRIIQQVNTIPLYIGYYLFQVDRHSIHAPFAFEFYTGLKRSLRQSHPIAEIEHFRNRYMRDDTLIEGIDYGAGSRIHKAAKVSSIAKYGISSRKDCMFIKELAEMLKSQTCIELGTSLGIATAYLAKSRFVKSIHTFEGNERLVQNSKRLFSKLKLQNIHVVPGNIDEVLTARLEDMERVDLAIIDANHTKTALLNYYQRIKPKIGNESVLLIDDIRWSREMNRAWNELIRKPEVSLSMEFLNRGILFFKKSIEKQHYVLA